MNAESRPGGGSSDADHADAKRSGSAGRLSDFSLAEARHALTPGLLQVYVLAALGKTIDESARLLDLPVPAVTQMRRRALGRLERAAEHP